MALVVFGRNCKGSFEGYRIVLAGPTEKLVEINAWFPVRLLKRPVIPGPLSLPYYIIYLFLVLVLYLFVFRVYVYTVEY